MIKEENEDTAENRLKDTLFIVEATTFEQFSLWQEYAKENRLNPTDKNTLEWKQVNPGWLVQVGKN